MEKERSSAEIISDSDSANNQVGFRAKLILLKNPSQFLKPISDHAPNGRKNENLLAANSRLVDFIGQMELPNLYRRHQDKLHTSRDGQK